MIGFHVFNVLFNKWFPCCPSCLLDSSFCLFFISWDMMGIYNHHEPPLRYWLSFLKLGACTAHWWSPWFEKCGSEEATAFLCWQPELRKQVPHITLGYPIKAVHFFLMSQEWWTMKANDIQWSFIGPCALQLTFFGLASPCLNHKLTKSQQGQ